MGARRGWVCFVVLRDMSLNIIIMLPQTPYMYWLLRTLPDAFAQVPDLVTFAMNQQLPKDMTAAEGVGGLTKLAFQGMFSVASHI